jgi:hypothetical protein
MSPSRPAQPRGATLLLVMIVLVVFLLLGAAALQLSPHEPLTVNRSIDHKVLLACADAAEKKLWAEYALYNGAMATVRVQPTVIPGTDEGLRLSIAHYDADPTAGTLVTFDERSFRTLDRNALSGNVGEMDQSNTFRTEFGGRPFLVVAHCTDAHDRQHEVELLVRFGL